MGFCGYGGKLNHPHQTTNSREKLTPHAAQLGAQTDAARRPCPLLWFPSASPSRASASPPPRGTRKSAESGNRKSLYDLVGNSRAQSQSCFLLNRAERPSADPSRRSHSKSSVPGRSPAWRSSRKQPLGSPLARRRLWMARAYPRAIAARRRAARFTAMAARARSVTPSQTPSLSPRCGPAHDAARSA
jgi:hypothetical protein